MKPTPASVSLLTQFRVSLCAYTPKKKMASSTNLSLGGKRLGLIHARVQYMLEKENFNETDYEQPQIMCGYCSKKFNLDIAEHPENKKFIYYRCSGKDWICQARHECASVQDIPWKKDWLMSHETYVKKVCHAIENMEPRIALNSLHKFHEDITREQHHMVKMTQIGEICCYPTFTPFQLENGMFPLPPIGEEWSPYQIEPWGGWKQDDIRDAQWRNTEQQIYKDMVVTYVQTCHCQESQMDGEDYCTVCGEGYDKKMLYYTEDCATDEGKMKQEKPQQPHNEDGHYPMPGIPTNPHWNKFCQAMLHDASHNPIPTMSHTTQVKTLTNLTVKDTLSKIHAIAGAPDPCEWCQWRKVAFPGNDIHCTGVYKLCYFKYTMFEEVPYGLNRFASMQHQIMKSDTVKEYGKFMDRIFSVDEIQRAITLKLMIDDDIAYYYPFMSKVMACYDALILRWYWGPYVLKEKEPSTSTSESETAEEEVVIEYTQL